jgi:hypothetical protein
MENPACRSGLVVCTWFLRSRFWQVALEIAGFIRLSKGNKGRGHSGLRFQGMW